MWNDTHTFDKFRQGLQLIDSNLPTPCVRLPESFTNGYEVWIKLDYLTHPLISGNKWRKLKYNLIEARALGRKKIITFGGAFSNHLIATASAGAEFGFDTIGIVRGDELHPASNPTLIRCFQLGMKLNFVTRIEYSSRNEFQFLANLQNDFPDAYIIPEGGTNLLAIKGIEEIKQEINWSPDIICCAVGTGGTLLGIAKAFNEPHQKTIGFMSLKANGFEFSLKRWMNENNLTIKQNWELNHDYHWGGYGKFDSQLLDFISRFPYPLDKIYTAKMIIGVLELLKKRHFPIDSKILIYHSGGLQGN